MEIRVLGPLELLLDGAVTPDLGLGERALVSLLATAPGRTFSQERLIDALWGEALPANPENALHVRVSRLRRLVGPALVRGPAGYRLDIPAEAVDAVRFERLIAAGRHAEALPLWRGPPLEEFLRQPWAQAEATRLEELRAVAVEEVVDARLAAGEHAALVPELEALIAASPLRERLRGQLMLALHRSGRTAEALAAFQAFRRLLDDELGMQPSQALRRMETAILREDPALTPPAAPAASPRKLPALLSSVVGRDEQVARLQRLLADARLVTLTGPGGVGKTTLAVAAAGGAPGTSDGVWFVPLAGVTDGRRIANAVADTIGLADPDSDSARRLVTSWLGTRDVLVVLDNCEHLADECAHLVEHLLQSSGGGLRILATSREALGVRGEVQLPVPPLPLDAARLLFAQRAASVDPDLVVADDDEHVGRICEQLDGIPLAIELAAARVSALTPEQIAARLDDRFRLLTLAPRTAEARHQTLRATVDWSHAMLGGEEQKLFRRLAVFRGGWSLEAAEEVCGEAHAPDDVLNVLNHLVARSLVIADRGRFRMLETIRSYAAEQLQESGEAPQLQRRHARFFTALAEAVEPDLRGRRQGGALQRLAADDANLRLAMQWSTVHRDDEPDLELRLGGALGWYWYVGRQVEGRTYLADAVAAASSASPAAMARCLQALSLAVRPVGCIVHPSEAGAQAATQSRELFERVGDAAGAAMSQLLVAVEGVGRDDPRGDLAMVDDARQTLHEAADDWGVALAAFVEMEIRLHHGEIARALELGRHAATAFDTMSDDWGRSAVRLHLGYGLRVAGRIAEAEDVLGEAVVLSREASLPNNLARAVSELGEAALHRGDPAAALPWFTQCAAIAADLGNDTLLALAELGQGAALRLRDHPAAAGEHFGRALALSTGADFTKGVVRARTGLAAAHLDQGDRAAAREHLTAALAPAERLGDGGLLAAALEQLARAAATAGDTPGAAAALERAERLRESHSRPRGALETRDVLPVTATTPVT